MHCVSSVCTIENNDSSFHETIVNRSMVTYRTSRPSSLSLSGCWWAPSWANPVQSSPMAMYCPKDAVSQPFFLSSSFYHISIASSLMFPEPQRVWYKCMNKGLELSHHLFSTTFRVISLCICHSSQGITASLIKVENVWGFFCLWI